MPSLGLKKETSNFGAALFSTYTFGKSPYSLAGWVEYFDSRTSSERTPMPPAPLIGSLARMREAIGFAVAPTWQYKDLFARANAGYIYLLNNKGAWRDLWLRRQRRWPQRVHRHARSRYPVLNHYLVC